jgi:hypothetical protein
MTPLEYTTFENSSETVISPSQNLYLTKHNVDKRDIHDPGGSRTLNPSKQVAVEPHLRQRGHRDLLLGCKD